MKKNDIVIGAEYAVGRDDYPDRCRVLEVGTYINESYSGRYGLTRTRNEVRGVKVETLNRETGESIANQFYPRGKFDWVPFQQVRCTWGAYLDAKRQRDEYRRNLEAAQARARDIRDELMEAIHGTKYGGGSVKIELTFDQAVRLLGMVRNATPPGGTKLV